MRMVVRFSWSVFIKFEFTAAGLHSLLCPEATEFLKSQAFYGWKKPWLVTADLHYI